MLAAGVQASVAAEIGARLELFRQSFEFCRQGGFSFARFLALVPDRLRLAVGDAGQRVRIPVTVAAEVAGQMARRLPDWPADAQPASIESTAELRRVVRLAQQDPGIDPLGLLSWLRADADPLVSLFGALYERGFSEVGRGEGGAETAYLIHLVIVELARRQVAARLGDRIEAQVILTSMLDASIQGVLGQSRVDERQLSPRLGYQLAATRSPLAFGADPDRLAARPVNAYRTTPRAVQLVRRVLQPPLEVIPLEQVAQTIAKRLLVEPSLINALLKDTLLEMLRDAALVAVVQGHRPYGGDGSDALRPLLASPVQLVQSVFNHPRRERLTAELRRLDRSKPIDAILRLLDGAPRVEHGDPAPLGVHGQVEERALVAARGAICLVLEAHAEALKREVNALVQWLAPEEAAVAVQEGRCYRLGLDNRPLFHFPARNREAFLFFDASELVRLTAERRPAALGDLVSRYLMTPLLERFIQVRGDDEAALRLIQLTPDQAAFAGEIGVVLEFAEAARDVVAELQAELARPVADVLGGQPNVVGEADEEIRRLEARIVVVDGALRRTPQSDESAQLLQDTRLMLERRLAVLTEAKRRAAGLTDADEVDVGLYVTFGATAVSVPVPEGVVRADAVSFSPHVSEARRGCARVPWVKDDRVGRVALRRRARGDEEATMPFALSLRARDERTAIFNAGCGLSETALKAYLRARVGVLSYFEVQLELRELSEADRRRFVFDRDPERFVLCLGKVDNELVRAFRFVGKHAGAATWELLPTGSAFLEVLVRFVPQAQELVG